MNAVKKLFLRFAYPLLLVYWFVLRPETTGVRCLITNGQRVLLIQHSYGPRSWSVPGGGVKSQESFLDAAKRETFEEVGITVSNMENLGQVFYDKERKKDTIWIFHTEVISTDFTIDNVEIINAQWFPFDELPLDSSPLLKQFLSLYHLKN